MSHLHDLYLMIFVAGAIVTGFDINIEVHVTKARVTREDHDGCTDRANIGGYKNSRVRSVTKVLPSVEDIVTFSDF